MIHNNIIISTMTRLATIFLAFLPFGLGSGPGHVVKLCKPGEADLKACWLKSVDDLVTYFVNGLPSHNIPPISPLYVPRHEINSSTYSAVLTNIKYDGILAYTICDVVPHSTDNSVVFKILISDLKFESDVKTTGSLDGIPLDGSGKVKMNFVNVTYDFEIKWRIFTVNGIKYHNVFCRATNVDYGVLELKSFDVIKDAETLEALKQKVHETKAAEYLGLLKDSFMKYLLRYILHLYNAFPVSD